MKFSELKPGDIFEDELTSWDGTLLRQHSTFIKTTPYYSERDKGFLNSLNLDIWTACICEEDDEVTLAKVKIIKEF